MSELVLVNVPIGNPDDISLRAIDALSEAKQILAEDTRKTKNLLKYLKIDYTQKKITSFHDHSSALERASILEKLKSGEKFYLVSDAGSPIISDPAFSLIREIKDSKIQLKSISGISAVINALELSCLSPQPFHFYGFLPREKGKVLESFMQILALKGTHIFFESPERIKKTLLELHKFNDLNIAIVRELTKTYETVYKMKSEEIPVHLDSITYKGEFVILVEVSKQRSKIEKNNQNIEKINEFLDSKRGPKQLAKLLSKLTALDSSEIYQLLNQSKN